MLSVLVFVLGSEGGMNVGAYSRTASSTLREHRRFEGRGPLVAHPSRCYLDHIQVFFLLQHRPRLLQCGSRRGVHAVMLRLRRFH